MTTVHLLHMDSKVYRIMESPYDNTRNSNTVGTGW